MTYHCQLQETNRSFTGVGRTQIMIALMIEIYIEEWYQRCSMNTKPKTIDYNNKFISLKKEPTNYRQTYTWKIRVAFNYFERLAQLSYRRVRSDHNKIIKIMDTEYERLFLDNKKYQRYKKNDWIFQYSSNHNGTKR